MSVEHCFICAGADDDPGFDECAVCGRKGVSLPYGGSFPFVHSARAAERRAAQRDESPLARAVRLARGDPADDVEDVLRVIAEAKAALSKPSPCEAATPVSDEGPGSTPNPSLQTRDTPHDQ